MKQYKMNIENSKLENGDTSKKRALIVGAGNFFVYSAYLLFHRYTIVGIADNSTARQGKELFGLRIQSIQEVLDLPFEIVIVTPSDRDLLMEQLTSYESLRDKLIGLEQALIIKENLEVGGKEDSLTDDKEIYELMGADQDRYIRIAVIMYGGMGDLLIGKNWLHYLDRHVGMEEKCIDIFVSGKDVDTAQVVFCDSKLINRVQIIHEEIPELLEVERYDLTLRFSIFPMVQMVKYRQLAVKNALLWKYVIDLKRFGQLHYNQGFFASPDFYNTVKHLFFLQPEKQYHTHFDVLDSLGADDTTVCPMHICENEETYLSSVGLERKKFITVNTGVNIEYREKTSTRIWSLEKWDELVKLLKKQFPKKQIVQIGLKRADKDDIGADILLNGKTSLIQTEILLKNSWLHFDYDSGLVHLRHMLNGGSSIVLLGSLGEEKHHYSENVIVRADNCMACEWTTRDWLNNCPRGFQKPICMQSITVDMVMEKIRENFGNESEQTE